MEKEQRKERNEETEKKKRTTHTIEVVARVGRVRLALHAHAEALRVEAEARIVDEARTLIDVGLRLELEAHQLVAQRVRRRFGGLGAHCLGARDDGELAQRDGAVEVEVAVQAAQRSEPEQSNMLGGASQTVSKIRVKCNGT